MAKVQLGVIFGSRSCEREVSIISAVQLMNHVDSEKYDVIPVYIGENGVWYTGNALRRIETYTPFDPNKAVTRQEMATMFYRYAKFAKFDVSAAGDLSVFPDENQVLDYAVDAMTWANGAGLITGNVVNDVTCLDPLGNANRAQVATILMRFCENVAK